MTHNIWVIMSFIEAVKLVLISVVTVFIHVEYLVGTYSRLNIIISRWYLILAVL